MRNKILLFDNKTQTTYTVSHNQSAQHGTVVILHFKKIDEGPGKLRLQFSEFYLNNLIEKGEVQWI